MAHRLLPQVYQPLLERLQSLPGVLAVGGESTLPMSGAGGNGTFIMSQAAASTAETLDEMLAAMFARCHAAETAPRCRISRRERAAISLPMRIPLMQRPHVPGIAMGRMRRTSP